MEVSIIKIANQVILVCFVAVFSLGKDTLDLLTEGLVESLALASCVV